jgi:hypothetical protein
MRRVLIFVAIGVIFSGCARTFFSIDPSAISYTGTKHLADDVYITYRYNVQEMNANRPYARKERKKDMRLIAVEIRNNSTTEFILNRDSLSILTPTGGEVQVLETGTYTKAIRQYSETFVIFYGLAGFGVAWGSDSNGEEFFNMSYNPIPLAVGVGNAIFAESSNSKQKRNLLAFEIFDKPIEPGEKLYGLLPVQTEGHPELIFKYLNQNE